MLDEFENNKGEGVTTKKDAHREIATDIKLKLGGQMVTVELDPEHYELAIKLAFERYRQRSSNALEESYLFLEIQVETNEYYLPKEVREVRKIYRRGVSGTVSGGGTHLDPFALSYTNMYLLEAGRQGGLATYDFFHQYQELMSRLFGGDMMFNWDPTAHKLTLMRRPLFPEQAVLWIYNFRPDQTLWADEMAKPWIRRWALAEAKQMLGEARSKYAQLAGPQGGTALNGDALKNEAMQEFEALEQEIINYVSSNPPDSGGFVIG